MPDPVVHVVSTFHHDIAYLRPCNEYLPMCFDIINRALALMERDPGYCFAIEQQFLWRAYWEAFPEKRGALRKYAAEGRLTASPGLLAVPDTSMTDGESMFLQACVGKRWLAEHVGLSPTVCLIADCWGHHSQLPQIVSLCGYKYYMFMRCMRRDVRDLGENFLWQGLDGTAVKTHWLSDGYAGIRFPTTAPAVNADEQTWLGIGADALRKGFDSRVAQNSGDDVLLPNGGDMQVPQASAPQALAALNRTGLLPAMRFSSFERYMDGVPWAQKPTVTGEFNTSFQGTLTTNIQIKQYNSRLVAAALSLESAAVLLRRPDIDLAPVWETLLKGQFHDTICGTLCDKALSDTLNEYRLAEALLSQKQRQLDGDAPPHALNPLGFARREIVEDGGRAYLVSLPAMSAAPLSAAAPLVNAQKPRSLPCAFENDFYAAKIDENGNIVSLLERASGRELVASRAYRNKIPVAFGEVHMQLDNGDNWNVFHAPWSVPAADNFLVDNYEDPYDREALPAYRNVGPFPRRVVSASVVCDQGERLVVEQVAEIGYWIIKAQITTRMTLCLHEPLIRYETQLLTSGKHVRFRVAFPANIQGGRVLHEIPFAAVERPRSEFGAMGFVDLSDENAGLSMLNIGQPGNCVDADGNLLLSLHRAVAMEYKCPSEASFNVGVPQRFSYAVLPHAALNVAAITAAAKAYRQPPIVVRAAVPEEGFTVSGENLLLSCARYDGPDVFLRVYETSGLEGRGSLHVPARFTSFAPADGLQRPAAPFADCGRTLPLALRPHEIQGFLFR